MTSVHQLLLSAATSALVGPLTLAGPAEARPYI